MLLWQKWCVCILLALLIVGTCWVWGVFLSRPYHGFGFHHCPHVPENISLHYDVHQEDPALLNKLTMIKPNLITIRILNATSHRGAAKDQLSTLKEIGFLSAPGAIGNDLWYPTGTLHCPSQIRFGSSGSAEAATLGMLFPCSQFLLDNRKDSAIELVVGTQFSLLSIDRAGEQKINALSLSTASSPADIHCGVHID